MTENEKLKKMQEFNRQQEQTHWQPVSNLSKVEQEIKDYHDFYNELWLSHLKGRE